jgi:hypothetical protein
LEDAARAGTRPYGNHEFRLRHLLVYALQPLRALMGHCTRRQQNVGVSGRGFKFDAEPFNIEFWRQQRYDFDVASVAGT